MNALLGAVTIVLGVCWFNQGSLDDSLFLKLAGAATVVAGVLAELVFLNGTV